MSLQTRNRAVSLPRFEAPLYERKEKMTQEDRLSLSFSGADQLDGFRELSERILITPGTHERLFWFDLVPPQCLITGSSSRSALFVAWRWQEEYGVVTWQF